MIKIASLLQRIMMKISPKETSWFMPIGKVSSDVSENKPGKKSGFSYPASMGKLLKDPITTRSYSATIGTIKLPLISWENKSISEAKSSTGNGKKATALSARLTSNRPRTWHDIVSKK